MTYLSAEDVQTASGRQYHIGLSPGDLSPYILLCGDPARAEKVARHFKKTKAPIKHREYVTITGEYEGFPISVMATGIGPDNTEIALVEISNLLKEATLLRIGSCSGLKKEMKLADVIISTGAVRLENTTASYVCEGYPAIAHFEAVLALIEAATKLKMPFHTGITATASGFYAPQGRSVAKFTPFESDLSKKLERMGVANFEMEASALFVLAGLVQFRAGAVCAVYGNRHENRFIDEETMKVAEERCILTGLEAMALLAKMDQKKKKGAYWYPSLGL